MRASWALYWHYSQMLKRVTSQVCILFLIRLRHHPLHLNKRALTLRFVVSNKTNRPRTLPLQLHQTSVSSTSNLLPSPTHLRSQNQHLMGSHTPELVPRNLVLPLLEFLRLPTMARYAMDAQRNRELPH